MGAGAILAVILGVVGAGAAVYYVSRPQQAGGLKPPVNPNAAYDGYGGFSQQGQQTGDNVWSFLTGASGALSNMLSTGYGDSGFGYSDHEATYQDSWWGDQVFDYMGLGGGGYGDDGIIDIQ